MQIYLHVVGSKEKIMIMMYLIVKSLSFKNSQFFFQIALLTWARVHFFCTMGKFLVNGICELL